LIRETRTTVPGNAAPNARLERAGSQIPRMGLEVQQVAETPPRAHSRNIAFLS
jgi:hypothetical protein